MYFEITHGCNLMQWMSAFQRLDIVQQACNLLIKCNSIIRQNVLQRASNYLNDKWNTFMSTSLE